MKILFPAHAQRGNGITSPRAGNTSLDGGYYTPKKQHNFGYSGKLVPSVCAGQSGHGFNGLNGFSPIG